MRAASTTGRRVDFAHPSKLERRPATSSSTSAPVVFPGRDSGPARLPRVVDGRVATDGKAKPVTFEFTPPDEDRPYIAVGSPVTLEGTTFGTLVVAKPKTELRERWLDADRAARARVRSAGWSSPGRSPGTCRAGSRRPSSQLSRAADEIARGQLRRRRAPSDRGGDEIGHLADRVREMTARLAEAEELERNFLMSVSHELRTPLTAIRGHVEALREGVVTDEELRAASLTVIAAEAARLERLVGDVLDLAKLDAHRFTVLHEEVDMGQLLEQAYNAFAEEARRRGIDYRQELAARPVIVSDGDRVLQIISNLLSNAFRWTPDGGRVELELGRDERHGRGRRRRHRAGDRARGAGADLPAVLDARREGDRPRACDRAGARRRARRPDRAQVGAWRGGAIRARAPGDATE